MEKDNPIEAPPLASAGCGPAMQGSYVAECQPGTVDTSGARRSPLFLIALVAATGLGPFAMSSFVPAIPAIQTDFNISPEMAQLTLSVSLITMALCALFYGTLADHFGRRPVVLGGMLLAIAGSLVCALGSEIGVVIAGRGLQAAGSSVGFVLARVIVRDVYGDQRAASVLGYITAAMTLAPLAGPLLGGYLIETFGWRSVFMVIALLGTVTVGLLYWQLPETRTSQTAAAASPFQPGVFIELLKAAEYRAVLLFGAALQATFMAFMAAAPFLLVDAYQQPISTYGVYFMGIPIGYFIGSVIAGRYSDAMGNHRLMRGGGILSLAACLAAVAAAYWQPAAAWGLFLPAAVIAIGHGAALPGAQVVLLNASGADDGAGSGLFSFLQLIVGALTAQLAGSLLGFGPAALTLLMTVVAGLALLGVTPSRAGDRTPDPTEFR